MATVATYRRSGEVLLSPVWFEWQNGGFNLAIGRYDFKTQHIRRDPRASIAVYESVIPLRGLEMRGTARLFTDGLHELRVRIWQRYMSAEPPPRTRRRFGSGSKVSSAPGTLPTSAPVQRY